MLRIVTLQYSYHIYPTKLRKASSTVLVDFRGRIIGHFSMTEFQSNSRVKYAI